LQLQQKGWADDVRLCDYPVGYDLFLERTFAQASSEMTVGPMTNFTAAPSDHLVRSWPTSLWPAFPEPDIVHAAMLDWQTDKTQE